MHSDYCPAPVDTTDVMLNEELRALIEEIAKNVHETWSISRMNEGWTYGEHRDDFKKQTPCLVPYELLPESEKEYDRRATTEVLKLILKLGFDISRRQ